MPKGVRAADSKKANCGYEYNRMVAELNSLDRFCTYVLGGPDGQVQMIYEDHIVEMFRDEVESRLEFLRFILDVQQSPNERSSKWPTLNHMYSMSS